ncbi:MAG: LysM peptidoglycan-binding domain-containing protein [Puniceicoccales bacterium]|jgi:LysM repeat protein|nr:LysM peptidoglycan-binding domain-containing protein [Puniceicoccales bacterium]
MKNIVKSVLVNGVKGGLSLVVLGLAGCMTPFGGRTEPSPEDTMVVHMDPPKPTFPIHRPIMATPRRPESEEVLIVEPVEVIIPPPIKPSGAEYTVQKGDCLSWIAKKFKLPLANLLDANMLDRNAKLSIGQKLILPGISQEQIDAIHEIPSEYVVKKGDCLSLIAHKYGVSIRELRMANNLKNDRIIAGKKLIIPERGRYVGRKENGNDEPKATKKSFEVNADGYYTVRKGDSLSAIASEAKVSVRDLQNWNNIADPAKIKVGERILVKNRAIVPEEMIKKEPTLSTTGYPLPAMRDVDFFGAIDEIPVVQVQD